MVTWPLLLPKSFASLAHDVSHLHACTALGDVSQHADTCLRYQDTAQQCSGACNCGMLCCMRSNSIPHHQVRPQLSSVSAGACQKGLVCAHVADCVRLSLCLCRRPSASFAGCQERHSTRQAGGAAASSTACRSGAGGAAVNSRQVPRMGAVLYGMLVRGFCQPHVNGRQACRTARHATRPSISIFCAQARTP